MRGNFKALGLALLAAFVMSAVVASSAQALAEFTAEDYPAVATGHQEGTSNYFESTPGRKVECKKATYEVTQKEVSSTITVTPHYSECTETSTGVNATIHLNGCHFEFHAGQQTSTTDVHGFASVICPAGKQITITVATCTVHVPGSGTTAGEPTNQTLTGVTFTNEPAGGITPKEYITVHVDITNHIHYTDTDGFLCPFEGNSTQTNGSFFSTVEVKGYFDKEEDITHPTTAGVKQYTHNGAQDIHVKETG